LYRIGILTCAEVDLESRIRKFQMEIYNPSEATRRSHPASFQPTFLCNTFIGLHYHIQRLILIFIQMIWIQNIDIETKSSEVQLRVLLFVNETNALVIEI